jgi:prepilin-type N-terminal cleavage/methylation domain-containing protein
MNYKSKHAFTLLEILLVVAALSILAGIVIIAINPSRQLATTRNAQRAMDVNTIFKAVYQYAIDHKGLLPASIGTTPVEICRSNAVSCAGMVNLSSLTDNGTYLVSLPIDPTDSSVNGTGYMIYKTSAGRPIVDSSLAELGQQISSGGQTRDDQRLADIGVIEDAMAAMYDAVGYYFVNPAGGSNTYTYKGYSWTGGLRRSTNCSTVTEGQGNGPFGSSIPCPSQSDWCIKLGADIASEIESSGASCGTGTVYLRNIPLNNHSPIGTWVTGLRPYEMFVVNNFDGSGNDYFRITYRLEGGSRRQSDHFLNGETASCGYSGNPVTNGITCE